MGQQQEQQHCNQAMASSRTLILLLVLLVGTVGGRRHRIRGPAVNATLPVTDELPPDQPPPATVNVDYPFPYMKGHPIDSCMTVAGTDTCGKASADYFCRFQKCEVAVSFAESQGNRGPTWVAGDGVVRETGGGSFDKITCQCSVPDSAAPGASDANQIDYTSPQILGHPVDSCLKKDKLNCGKPAADAFCQSFGNTGSTRFVEESAPKGPTWFIGDHALNEAEDRHSFKYVRMGRDEGNRDGCFALSFAPFPNL